MCGRFVFLQRCNQKTMEYSRANHIQRYINIQQIVLDHYDPDVTTYAGIWRKYVLPVYPMTYKRFIEIINMPRLKEQLAVERAKKNPVIANQLDLFTDS